VLARISIRGTVPTLHRLNRDPISDRDSSALQRSTQRRIFSTYQFVVARNRQYQRPHVRLKALHLFHRSQSQYRQCAHSPFRSTESPSHSIQIPVPILSKPVPAGRGTHFFRETFS